MKEGDRMHLILDGHSQNAELLTKSDLLKDWLIETVKRVGMQLVAGPWVVDYPAGDGEERGLTGVAILAESSITVHTYPELNFAFIDIFSCRSFDSRDILSWTAESFGLTSICSCLLERGVDGGKPKVTRPLALYKR